MDPVVLPSDKLLANYVVVLCRATVAIVQQVKQKGFLTKKEKLHCLQFLFFILENFKQNIQLESHSNSNCANNNRIFGSSLMINNPQ